MSLQEAFEDELLTSGNAALAIMSCVRPVDWETLLSAWKTAGVLQECVDEDAAFLKKQILQMTEASGFRYDVWNWISPVLWEEDVDKEEQVYQFLAASGVAVCMKGYLPFFQNQWEEWLFVGIQQKQIQPLSIHEVASEHYLQKLISRMVRDLKLPEVHPFVAPLVKLRLIPALELL